jgi:hypothetical protein
MRKVILSENQFKILVDNIISEQNLSKTQSITINFGSLWPMGKWKLTQEQQEQITIELVKIVEFMNKNRGSKITIQIESGESQVNNKDTEVDPPVSVKKGYLSQKRGESLKTFLENYFKSLVGKKINENEIPVISPPKSIIGTTKYNGPSDLENPQKVQLYNSEQFVRAIITAEKTYECLVGLEITIGYYEGKNSKEHECDEAIFELRMNGVRIGEVNLNNGLMDFSIDDRKKQEEKRNETYLKKVERFEKLLKQGYVNDYDRQQMVGEPPKRTYHTELIQMAKKSGYENDMERFMNDIATINTSFEKYNRKSDKKKGGSRSQTFVINNQLAQSIMSKTKTDNVVLSIVPLVSKDGKYKIFYNEGSHGDTPWVTIVNPQTKQVYFDGEPNVDLERGSTKETILLNKNFCS